LRKKYIYHSNVPSFVSNDYNSKLKNDDDDDDDDDGNVDSSCQRHTSYISSFYNNLYRKCNDLMY